MLLRGGEQPDRLRGVPPHLRSAHPLLRKRNENLRLLTATAPEVVLVLVSFYLKVEVADCI